MDEKTTRLALLLVGPGTLAVFGLAFLWAWVLERKRHYLLLLSGSCLLFVLGALTQIFGRPADIGLNAIISNTFYISAVLAVAEGILLRSGKKFGLTNALFLLMLFNVLIWYFSYIDRDLVMRIYIQNFGAGLILLLTALHLTRLARGRLIDRTLFWTLLFFAIQFFPRTILTVDRNISGVAAFGNSLFWQVLQLSLAVLGSGLAFVILAAAITDVIEDLRRERDLDRLTGVLNRRGFDERVDDIISKSDCPMAMILCDLDHFKKINDSFGHATGDDVLCAFGAVLRRSARKYDLVGRIGGEEFAILLPDTDASGAQEFVKRLQSKISTTAFPLPGTAPKVTCSIGAAVSNGAEGRMSLFKRADAALYRAKNAGRNRVAFSTSQRSPSALAGAQ